MKSCFLFIAFWGACLLLGGCAETCNGSIETTVLYAKPGANAVGRSIYVNVVNRPDLGIRTTLLYEGKEFGTFEHVVIINDLTNRFAANRTICFTNYKVNPRIPGGDLQEIDIPNITVE